MQHSPLFALSPLNGRVRLLTAGVMTGITACAGLPDELHAPGMGQFDDICFQIDRYDTSVFS
jgi:hypothetical protein